MKKKNKIRPIDYGIGFCLYCLIEINLIGFAVIGTSGDLLDVKWYAPICGMLGFTLFIIAPHAISALAWLTNKGLSRSDKKEGG